MVTKDKSKLHLQCMACGGKFDAVSLPQMHCPHCGILGYQDSTGANLISLGWNCPHCGDSNTGNTNFCLSCGRGLTSRCLRCESPVYHNICHNCGAHQNKIQQFVEAEERQTTWIPVLQSHAEQSIILPKFSEPIPIPVAPQPPSSQPVTKQAKPKRRFNPMGLLLVIAGIFFLISNNPVVVETIISDLSGGQFSLDAPISSIEMLLSTISEQTLLTLATLEEMPTDSPDYALLFLIAVLLLSAIPFGFHAINRLIKAIFP